MNYLKKVIKEICDEENIEFDLVSKDWIIVLKKDNIVRYITGYKFDLNDHAVGQICDDKYALYSVLKKFNINVAEHYIIFKNYNKDELKNYALGYNYNLIVKSNKGSCGNDMCHVTNEDDLIKEIDMLLLNNYSISISPYYDIKNEYRTIILNGNVELFYGKKKPIVIGDGNKTIYELLCDFNEYYFKNIFDNSLNRVLEKDEIFEYNWQFNLSKGAMPFIVKNDNLKQKIQKLAIEVANILNLNFASIDIIELKTGEILVLEANSGVMMDNFSKIISNGEYITKNIYKKVIKNMFNYKS